MKILVIQMIMEVPNKIRYLFMNKFVDKDKIQNHVSFISNYHLSISFYYVI